MTGLTALFIFLAASSAPVGDTAKGLWIAEQAEARHQGYHSQTAAGRMVLSDRRGRTSVREFRSQTLEVADDGDKSLIVFERPPDIARTALLSLAHRDRDDDQWLFLPALKRVKRISGTNRSGSFVGSEFAYEDLVEPEIEKYRYRWLRDEPCPGATTLVCHVNEQTPVSPESGYSRLIVWLDQQEYRLYQIHFFDRKGAHFKTLEVRRHQQYEGRHWRAMELVMTNYQNGRSTQMSWQNYDFSVRLRDEDFTRRALERLR